MSPLADPYRLLEHGRELERELHLMTADHKHGWDTAREADREYRKIHALLTEVKVVLTVTLANLDISTKLPPK